MSEKTSTDSSQSASELSDRINQFPDTILLEIFSYLPVKERCLSGRVCRRWRRIVADNTLWRHVDLLPYQLDLPRMWKVLRAHFSSCLHTMKVKGFAQSAATRKRKKTSMSDSMMKELSTRCPNLTELHLSDCKTENLSFDSLPSSITSLSVVNSTWQPRWLKDKHNHLPNLHTLDLSYTVRVDRFDLHDIALMPNLKHLSLCGCYRIRSSDVEIIAKNLVQLESLDLGSIGIDDLAVHHISRNLVNLKRLTLSGGDISDSMLATIGSCLHQLCSLDIQQANRVSIFGLKCLCSLEKLKVINFVRQGNRLSQNEKQYLSEGFVQPVRIIEEMYSY